MLWKIIKFSLIFVVALCVVLGFIAAIGYSTEDSFTVLKQYNTVTVVSRTDKTLTISNLVINKGNCKPSPDHSKPISFGEKAVFISDCNIVGVDFDTDDGQSFYFEWKD